MLIALGIIAYLLVGLFVSGIVQRLLDEDKWWHDPGPFCCMVFWPLAIFVLLSYALIQAVRRIPLPDKSLMPVALGYRLTHWMMTPKTRVEQKTRVVARVPDVELVEAEQEVEALLSNTGVQQ